jgi:heme exporter protein A
MLCATNLECVKGERRLFSGLNFSVAAGQILLVHGPNGSGKTSLLRIVCGLGRPTHGSVTWQGKDIASQRENFARALAYLGHANALKSELGALENIRLAFGTNGVTLPTARIREALRGTDLNPDLPIKFLSQGQRRRVCLARLWLCDALLWVLDEPLTSLDAAAIIFAEEMIAHHARNGGVAIVSTHQELHLPDHLVNRLLLGAAP